MRLPDNISEQVHSLAIEGSIHFDDGSYAKAIERWMEALLLIPNPKQEFEDATRLFGSLGAAYFLQSKYEDAVLYLTHALHSPGGHDDPYIRMRLGQSQLKLGQQKLGFEQLKNAYSLRGQKSFRTQKEDLAYLEMLKKRKLI